MAIAEPRIHIICGICGCNKMFKYEKYEIENDDDISASGVYIKCDNCASITDVGEMMEQGEGE